MESIAAPWSLRSVIDAKGRLAVLCAKLLAVRERGRRDRQGAFQLESDHND
jgi:hypothetical protein